MLMTVFRRHHGQTRFCNPSHSPSFPSLSGALGRFGGFLVAAVWSDELFSVD